VPRRPSCYVAGPLGFNEGSWYYYRHVYLPELRKVVKVVDPWRELPEKWDPSNNPWKDARSEEERRDISLRLGRQNAKDIEGCDWLVAYLDGQEPDSGTVVEVGYAAGLRKKCFGLRSDTRQAGEPGVRLNLQVETIIVDSGGAVYKTLDALVEGLRAQLAAYRSELRSAS
jgi:nucleoside 2-deoxyribosyltransferase